MRQYGWDASFKWILTDKEKWYKEHALSSIARITIKGASGYGAVDETYEDRLTITSLSISYEYKLHPMSISETNIYRNWSYKTNSPLFEELYRRVAEMTLHFLYNDEILFCTDIGPTTITAKFDDKHRETVNYFCPREFFTDYFRTIKQMVPATEYTLAVLLTDEDFEAEEDNEGRRLTHMIYYQQNHDMGSTREQTLKSAHTRYMTYFLSCQGMRSASRKYGRHRLRSSLYGDRKTVY